MKKLRQNIRVVTALLCALFLLLAGYGAYSLTTYGNRWFSSSANTLVRTARKSVIPGDVYDRAGVLLAGSDEKGERVYMNSAAARMAVAHALGDDLNHVQSGVETFMAKYLYGFETSYLERLTAAFEGKERKGDTLTLTLSSALCTYIAGCFPQDKAGAVVVMNYETGEVLALQSYPSFDPSNVTAKTEADAQQPFFNRATQGTYAPGSTFKVVTLSSALQNISGASEKKYACDGQLKVLTSVITDAGTRLNEGKIVSHGALSLLDAFRVSCNNTFARVALELGDARLKKTAEAFGFGDNFLFRDLVVENSSYPTVNRTDFELAWTGAGQSALLATPLHMCMIAAGVANDGVMMEPRLLSSVVSDAGKTRLSFASKVYRRALGESDAATIRGAMRSVVLSGTGTGAAVSGLSICGKTGSAQVDTQENTNAWFIGFIDDEKYPYAVSVVIENAGGGGEIAAPVAKKIFKFLSEK